MESRPHLASPPRSSPRLLAHLDLDAFFAAVEELEHPELKGRPLVVGGDPKGRGVVATANYEARRYGVRSAMPAAEALRRCPEAVFVRPSKGLYGRYSRQVFEIVSEIVPLVERVGLDEGYLDLGTEDPDEALALARRVQEEILTWTTLSCSLGVAAVKVVAKVASDHDKPQGLVLVRPGQERAFLAPFPVRLLPGVGPRAEERLSEAGVDTVGRLAELDDAAVLAVWRSKVGLVLRDRARGLDPRAVLAEPEPAVSYSQEETFANDVHERALLEAELERMSEELASRLVRADHGARTVTVKLRYPDFSTRTRQTTLRYGTDEPVRIFAAARLLLARALRERDEPLRLIGLSVSGFVTQWQLELPLASPPLAA